MQAPRIFLIHPGRTVDELDAMPERVPEGGFLWIAAPRAHIEQAIGDLQSRLHQLTGLRLLDLHVLDLLNTQLPSHFDYTSDYDMLVFRRLSGGVAPATQKVLTAPVGFVVFDAVLLSVHPADCPVLDTYVRRLKLLTHSDAGTGGVNGGNGTSGGNGIGGGMARLPASPAELMLRIVSLMVDAYLELRKTMTRQLDHWQQRLMRPNTRFDNWQGLLKARQALHHLNDICEDQRNALSRWVDVLEDWPRPKTAQAQREHDLLLVRSRDVLEHIGRVAQHVRQLEQSAETAVQIHFNIQSNRTNDVMRTLTAVTAVFLPLNLIAGIFGMNFEFIPWLHDTGGFWWAMAAMGAIAAALVAYFVRKHYLGTNDMGE